MKRPINIKETFLQIRKLPLEITFARVENWVYKQNIKPAQRNRWIKLFLTKFYSLRSKN